MRLCLASCHPEHINLLTMASTITSSFPIIINSALEEYTKQTGIDLTQNPFTVKIQQCNSLDGVLGLFQERAKEFKEYRDGNRKLINCLTPVVRVLHALSGILGDAISLPFPPAKAIFVGMDVLLAAASGISSSYDALEDLFQCVQNFLQRLHVYTQIPPTTVMTHILVKIMVQILSVLGLATKQIKQGRFKKFAKKLLGETEIEAVLHRLDRLTHEEARMTVAQTLEVVHGLMGNLDVVIDDGKASVSNIRKALVSMQETAGKINKMERDQLQKDVRNWLSPPNHSTNHNIARRAHQRGTATWFLEGSIISEWKERGSLLWIHGKPGSGKSILLSAIIEDVAGLRAAGLASMVYYYFDFRDTKKQNRHGLLSSLLTQLSAQSNPFHDVVSRLYAAHDSGIQDPANDTLAQSLKEMLKIPGQGPIYIIIDALDECPNVSGMPTSREEVLELVEELVNLELPNVHICVTSRPEFDIRAVLEPLTTLRVSLHEESGQKQDIMDYVTKIVNSDRKMRSWREQDKQLVIDVLSEKADGMFRWVYCQLESLRRNLPASIQGALDQLPKTLDETYRHALFSIEEEKREYAQRLFKCLTVSIRPLHVAELAEVLAIRFETDALPNYDVGWRLSDAEEAVLSVGSSLISVVNVDDSKVVQFSHFSVKEFLTSDHLGDDLSGYHILPGPAHTILAKACLSILLKLDDRIDKATIENLPLADYAARHWVEHARFDDVSSSIQDEMQHLFDPGKSHFSAWVWVFNIDRPWVQHMSTIHPTPPEATPLYYAVLCGFYYIGQHLLVAHQLDVNARGDCRMSPLQAALMTRNLKVAGLLLQHGAEVDVWDENGFTPLHRASQGGNTDIARFLLENNADVNAREMKDRVPLHFASMEGQLEMVSLLLQHGAIVDCYDEEGMTPLHCAAGPGHLDISLLLLDRDVDVEVQDNKGRTPLHLVSSEGDIEVAKLLIQRGAAVDSRNNENETPLDCASLNGHLDIVRLLIESGAKVSSRCNIGWTPLHSASFRGHLHVVEFLLRCDANHDVGVQNANGQTALILASRGGKHDVVRFLIDQGADLNSPCKHLWVALHWATQEGHLDIVQLLLDRGADVNVQGNHLCTPLHVASQNGHIQVAQLLVDRGAIVDSCNDQQQTPLHWSAGNGQVEVVHFLLESGANVHATDKAGWTPLHKASWNGHLKIIGLFLSRGADLNSRDRANKTAADLASENYKVKVADFLVKCKGDENVRNGICSTGLDIILHDTNEEDITEPTSLHAAVAEGKLGVVQSLLVRGADVNARNAEHQTLLELASERGHFDIVHLLIERGAEVDSRSRFGWTPLHEASLNGHTDVARLLIDHGADVNARTQDSWSPIHFSAVAGQFDVVELLLARGANPHYLTYDGRSAFELARGKGYREVVHLLREQDAK